MHDPSVHSTSSGVRLGVLERGPSRALVFAPYLMHMIEQVIGHTFDYDKIHKALKIVADLPEIGVPPAGPGEAAVAEADAPRLLLDLSLSLLGLHYQMRQPVSLRLRSSSRPGTTGSLLSSFSVSGRLNSSRFRSRHTSLKW